MEFKTDALMLKAVDYGENDKMVTLLTADRGKIGACMKGVKKANARLRFAAQPFCFAEYVLAEKSGRHTVISASLYDGFFPLCEDVEKYYAAAVVCEACEKLAFEGMPCGELLVAAVTALKELCGEETAFPLVKFLLTALRLAGYPIRAELPALAAPERSNADTLAVPERESTRAAGERVLEEPLSLASLASSPARGAKALTVPERETPLYSPSPTRGGGVGEGGTSFSPLFFDMERGAFSLEKGTPASVVTYFTIREALGYEAPPREKEGEKRALRLLYSYFAYQTDSELSSLPEFVRTL